MKKALAIIICMIMMLGILPLNNASASTTNLETQMNYSDRTLSAMRNRATMIANYKWVAQKSISKWNSSDYFSKGSTVTGVPYTLFNCKNCLPTYDLVTDDNYTLTAEVYGYGQRTGPYYGSCCASFVCEVFGKNFVTKNSNGRWYTNSASVSYFKSNSEVNYLSNKKINDIKPGDALVSKSGGHIIWVYDIDQSKDTITIAEQTPSQAVISYNVKISAHNNNGTFKWHEEYPDIVRPKWLHNISTGLHTTKNISSYLSIRDAQDKSATRLAKIRPNAIFRVTKTYGNGWARVAYKKENGTTVYGYALTEYMQSIDNPFTDVSDSKYYYEAAIWAYRKGIVTGTDAGKFSPNDNLTRCDFAVMMWRNAGSPSVTYTNTFSDIPKGEYYTQAVLWAYQNGIMAGVGNNQFAPKKSITREQVITVLWALKGRPNPTITKSKYTDLKNGTWYTNAVLWAEENGYFTNVITGNVFGVGNACTRGMAVTLMYRIICQYK